MIAARQIAFGGGKRKPYDAEIEYLESTGTQWIDTGVVPFVGMSVLLTILTEYHSGYLYYYGVHSSLNNNMGCVLRNGNNATSGVFIFYGLGKTTNVNNGIDGQVSELKIVSNGANADWYVNGVKTSTLYNIVAPTAVMPMALFGVLTESTGVVSGIESFKCYGFSVSTESGEKILDLIPVRKGNIGYMYDRVSGQLFGNQGTGEFVLGDDL